MNWKTTFHLVRTELHRNLWIIVALWIVAILVTDIFLSGLVAGLLVARIAQGDHLTRPAAHWRCRPVSLLTWSVSRVLLLFFLILIPVTIQQGWIAHSRGFDQGATMWAMIEVAVITSVFISVMFALATAASNWVTFAFLIAAVFTYAAVAGMIAADWSDFSRRDPPGVRSFYTSNSYHAWPLPWWIFWLGTISVSLGVLFLHGKLRQGKLTFLSLGIGVTAFVVGVMWAEGSAYQIRIQNVSGEIALVETSKEDRPSAMQKVYQNIGISGLAGRPWSGFFPRDIGSFRSTMACQNLSVRDWIKVSSNSSKIHRSRRWVWEVRSFNGWIWEPFPLNREKHG